jgi:hypothetical protein
MRYTSDIAEFIRYNHSEVSCLVANICTYFDLTSHIEDVIQDLYAKFLSCNILERFDPEYRGGTKISTYLHIIIVNMVKAICTDKENWIERRRFRCSSFQKVNLFHDPYHDEVENALQLENMNVDYEGNLYSNYTTEPIDGLKFDLDFFETYLKEKNRTYKLNRRRCQNVKSEGLSLLDVFQYLRKGYSHKAIAFKYGVSLAFITSLKAEIKLLMIKFGIIYGFSDRQK